MSLFDTSQPELGRTDKRRPLADRMRPESLEELAGQEHILAPGKPLRAQIERDIRSQNNLPTTPVPQEQSQMFRPTPTDQVPKDMDAELMATWNSAAGGTH